MATARGTRLQSRGAPPWRLGRLGGWMRMLARALVVTTGGAGALACTGDSTLAPGATRQDLETGYWQLTVNHRAVTLSTVAPYDTIRLVAVPRNARGAPLTGPVLDSVVTTYGLRDPSDTSLVITAAGLVRAHAAHDGSVVLVRTQIRGVTRVDSIPVNVTDTATPPQVTALMVSVTPDTITNVFVSFSGPARFRVQATDAARAVIPHVAVYLATDTSRIHIDPDRAGATTGTWSFKDERPAVVPLVAEATIYGVTVRDSVSVTLTPPAAITLDAVFGTPRRTGQPVGHFEPAVDTLLVGTDPIVGDVGALVIFRNQTATPIDVVWDDPTAVVGSSFSLFCGSMPGGNIPAFVTPTEDAASCQLDPFGQLRLLPTPGTYHYHSALYGTAGTIVVLSP